MRWDDLFTDLDSRFEVLAQAAEDAEQADAARIEFGRVSMLERLAGAVGGHLRLRLAGGRVVSGRLARVGSDWLHLREHESAELLVALGKVVTVEGVSARTGQPLGPVDAAFDLRKALRSVARDRAPVTIHTLHDTELSGTIDRVGADFLELATHPAWEARRSTSVRGVQLIPLAGIVAVRSVPVG